MAYTPTTWVTGDTITATKLNNIESGVQSVSSSYTPTTWVTGDIITAVKLNNIEQGIANAGGGAGEMISVTLISTNANRHFGFNAMAWDEEVENGIITAVVPIDASHWLYDVYLEGVINETKEFLRLADSFSISCGQGTTTVTGNATANYDAEYGYTVTITGDCTITIS